MEKTRAENLELLGNLLNGMEQAVNNSMASSTDVNEIVGLVLSLGFDLNATLEFSVGAGSDRITRKISLINSGGSVLFTNEDLNFLQRAKILVD